MSNSFPKTYLPLIGIIIVTVFDQLSRIFNLDTTLFDDNFRQSLVTVLGTIAIWLLRRNALKAGPEFEKLKNELSLAASEAVKAATKDMMAQKWVLIPKGHEVSSDGGGAEIHKP